MFIYFLIVEKCFFFFVVQIFHLNAHIFEYIQEIYTLTCSNDEIGLFCKYRYFWIKKKKKYA